MRFFERKTSGRDQGELDMTWDRFLNDMLDKGVSIEVGEITSKMAGLTVWTSNYPYAYGYMWKPENHQFLPTLKTRKRLKGAVDIARRTRFHQLIEEARKAE